MPLSHKADASSLTAWTQPNCDRSFLTLPVSAQVPCHSVSHLQRPLISESFSSLQLSQLQPIAPSLAHAPCEAPRPRLRLTSHPGRFLPMMLLAPPCWDWDLATSVADGKTLAVVARLLCQRAPFLPSLRLGQPSISGTALSRLRCLRFVRTTAKQPNLSFVNNIVCRGIFQLAKGWR
jgi:hypothetical protein